MKHGHIPFIAFVAIVVLFFGAWVFLGVRDSQPSSQASPHDASGGSLQDALSRVASQGATDTNVQNLIANTQTNLTEKLADNLSSQFLTTIGTTLPPSGIGGDFTALLESEDFNVDEVIESLSQNAPVFVANVSDKDIIVSQDQSPQAIRAYGQQYTIIVTQAGGFIGDDADKFADILSDVEAGDVSDLSILADDIEEGIAGLQRLAVPLPLKEFHKMSLAMFINMFTVFDALVKGDEDPLRAYIAVKDVVPRIYTQLDEIDGLFKDVTKTYNF